MHSEILTPAKAAERILGFYDTIPALAPQAFAAGLVEILSNYPQPVIDRAASPSQGLAAFIAYPNLAKYREKLEAWAEEYYFDVERKRRANTKRLPEPPRDPVGAGIGPSTLTDN
jgi:hypothetical protein